MTVLETALVIAGILVGIVVLVFLLALFVRRDERPLGRTARVIAGAHFWYLAVPAWFSGVGGLTVAARRPAAPTGLWIVSIAILVLGFLVAGFFIAIWWRSRRQSRRHSRAPRPG